VIEPERFIARSSDRDAWLEARTHGVTATAVAKAASGPAGFRDQLEARRNPVDIEVNAFMAWGTFMEPVIARWVKDEFGIMPNEWLIASEHDERFLATPDGLSLDHTEIAEIKTMGKPLEKPPLDHIRQMQWQLMVTGAEKCLYAWQLRAEVPGGFAPGWLEPRSVWIERDEKMIADLVTVAERLIGETDG
jgi:predicted phage-related endonuclease